MIVDTVLELSAEGNPSEITTAAIAGRMGLTQGALFRHFPTKEAVWSATLKWVSERLLSRTEQAMKKGATSLSRLEFVFMENARFVSEHPGAPRLLFSVLQRGGESTSCAIVRSLMKRYSERLQLIVEEGKAAGEIRKDAPSETVSHLFIGIIQGIALQSMIAGDADVLLRSAPDAFELLRRGIEEVGRS